MTQRTVDRLLTSMFCGLLATLLGFVFLWTDGSPWFVVPFVTVYAAWMASGFDITKKIGDANV